MINPFIPGEDFKSLIIFMVDFWNCILRKIFKDDFYKVLPTTDPEIIPLDALFAVKLKNNNNNIQTKLVKENPEYSCFYIALYCFSACVI